MLGTGSTGYKVKNNFIAANLTAGNGGGIAHIGLSPGGVIDGNTVIFNESFVQATGTNGGGIFIGGTPPAAGASTLGSGQVEVTNNLIQGNAASGGDGGGIALLGFTASDRVRLYNNVIANNVAGLAGGGISIEGVPTTGNGVVVDIVHNTIVDNDSTGTAGAAFTAGPLTSVPQPAGIAGRGAIMSRVRIANSIVWHNRTFYFGPCTPPPGGRCGILPVGPTDPTQYRRDPDHGAALLGSREPEREPVQPKLRRCCRRRRGRAVRRTTSRARTTSTTTRTATRVVAPAFVNLYFNTDRRQAYQVGETTGEATLISVPAALDEGGNFIRPQFGPLSLENPNSGQPGQGPFFGNYHLTAGVNGGALCGGGSLYGGSCTTNNQVPVTLLTDFDQQGVRPARRTGARIRSIAPIPTTPVPPRSYNR